MSVRHGLLALLGSEPMYGAQLRAEFERRTGGTWPLNVGQVYTTLDRLERDGLVESAGVPDGEGRINYQVTIAGRQEVADWWAQPVTRDSAPRSELAIKFALAVTLTDVNVPEVVQVQRTATIRHLQELTRLKRPVREGMAGADLAWTLVLEHLVFTAEAEVRWLDHVEARLAAARASRPAGPTGDRPPVVEPDTSSTNGRAGA